MRTNFYIDGFNLYHRALKRAQSLKWLNLGQLAQELCPSDDIGRIHYFTARVIARKNDLPNPKDNKRTGGLYKRCRMSKFTKESSKTVRNPGS